MSLEHEVLICCIFVLFIYWSACGEGICYHISILNHDYIDSLRVRSACIKRNNAGAVIRTEVCIRAELRTFVLVLCVTVEAMPVTAHDRFILGAKLCRVYSVYPSCVTPFFRCRLTPISTIAYASIEFRYARDPAMHEYVAWRFIILLCQYNLEYNWSVSISPLLFLWKKSSVKLASQLFYSAF